MEKLDIYTISFFLLKHFLCDFGNITAFSNGVGVSSPFSSHLFNLTYTSTTKPLISHVPLYISLSKLYLICEYFDLEMSSGLDNKVIDFFRIFSIDL